MSDIEALTPQTAAAIANHVYQTRVDSFTDVSKGLSRNTDNAFELQNVMEGVAGPRPLDWNNGFGYIARSSRNKNEALLATRGTVTLMDVWTDGNGSFARSPSGFPVHSGFNDTYRSFRPAIMSWFEKNRDITTVHCVGHSLGAGLATLAADDLTAYGKSVALYTFGSPRVGTDSYSAFMAKKLGDHNYRVHNRSDPVTMVGPWMYRHLFGANYRLPWDGWSISFGAHKMANYIDKIGQAAWTNLAQAPDNPAQAEEQARALLDSPSTGEAIMMYSTAGLSIIAKCLGWLLQKGATALGAAALAGLTVIDQLSMLLYASAALSNPGTAVVFALKWIMKFLGRNADSIKDASMAVIRYCLGLFLSVVNGMARQAVYSAMYMPLM